VEPVHIWRCAKLLIGQHGQDAPLHAAKRTDKLARIAGRSAGGVTLHRVGQALALDSCCAPRDYSITGIALISPRGASSSTVHIGNSEIGRRRRRLPKFSRGIWFVRRCRVREPVRK
jgi:hypothetical protein